MSKYDQHLQFVKDNMLKLSHKELADHTGCGVEGLKKQITKWRSEGHAIPVKPNHKVGNIGEEMMRKYKGVLVPQIRTENGWRLKHPVVNNYNKKIENKSVKHPKVSVAPKKIVNTSGTRQTKPQVRIMKTRDKSNEIRKVRVDSKTELMIKETDTRTDLQVIEDHYRRRRA